jgi:hypothetical protein
MARNYLHGNKKANGERETCNHTEKRISEVSSWICIDPDPKQRRPPSYIHLQHKLNKNQGLPKSSTLQGSHNTTTACSLIQKITQGYIQSHGTLLCQGNHCIFNLPNLLLWCLPNLNPWNLNGLCAETVSTNHHSSDILPIWFKHTRIIRFFGLFKKYLKILDTKANFQASV